MRIQFPLTFSSLLHCHFLPQKLALTHIVHSPGLELCRMIAIIIFSFDRYLSPWLSLSLQSHLEGWRPSPPRRRKKRKKEKREKKEKLEKLPCLYRDTKQEGIENAICHFLAILHSCSQNRQTVPPNHAVGILFIVVLLQS